MANVLTYTRALITVNGNLLAEEASVTVTQNSGAQVVNTVAKGFAGVSPGAGNTEIDVDSAVPARGFEFDPTQPMYNNEPVEVGVTLSDGSTLTVKGFIMSQNFKHAVNSESMLSFKFQGGIAKFE